MSEKTANAKIGDICDLVNGRAFKPADWGESGLPIVRIQNLNDETKPFNYYDGDYSPKHEVNSGDLLFSWSGTPGTSFGAFFWNRGKGVLNQHIFNVHFDRSRVDGGYFRYAINNRLIRIIGQAHGGVGLKHITKGRFEAVEIPLPPLSEQKRIAEILDRAESLRAKRRAALALLDELTQSIFLDMFGDPVSNPMGWDNTKTIADVASVGSGITKGRRTKDPVRTVPYMAVVNVQDKSLDLSVVKTIDATDKEIDRYRLKRNDLLLTEGGDADKLGRGTLWNDELPECIHQNHIFRVRLETSDVTPLFLNWLIGGPRGKSYFLRQAKQTTGIATINMTQLKAFPMLIPPLNLQDEFAKGILRIENMRSKQMRSLDQFDQLFASLQHRAFRGEL
ncbi:restriction endonuclease subunit S [Rosistilla oblonga]|uniref:restriction endonuclease subunit S n=1 Tax=Rosistilla oblonga TaxID=2527990 RepID=UPI003A97C14F